MKILSSAFALDLSGVPTATLTMYKELVKRGHDITVYSPGGGKLESDMKTVRDLNNVQTQDVIIAQNNICANALHLAFPNTPTIFFSHSIWIEEEQPPDFKVDWYIAINEAVRDNLKRKGVSPSKITIIRDFIDTERFFPVKPINQKLERVLFISNYKKWKNYKMVSRACQELEISLTCCGSPYGRNYKIEEAINEADLVISWGRGILEAMACSRAVVSFDKLMGDGYLTPEKYFQARQDNFCGFISKHTFDSYEDLADELLKYDPICGEQNRDLVLRYHNAESGVDQLLDVIKKL